ncbi:MAG: Uma2 family endonuclease [Myxococcota bacterium]|nr:Uma2 family endonuclease [Myxococcota bacterium]
MRAPSHRYTWDDYLRVEETSSTRHEFFSGEIYAMAGGTVEHAELCVNLTATLRNGLQGRPCRVFSSDLMVRVRATGLGTYPDASVVCGELELDPDSKRRTLLNPTALFEVLSSSTEDYDRGAKLEHFQQLPSLQEYVLLSSRERLIEVFRRSEGGWVRTQARTGEALQLESVSCRLAVDDLYANLAI